MKTIKTIQKQTQVQAMLLLLVFGILTSCTRDFDPINEVNKLRILAIKSDQPDVDFGETAELSALVHDPDGRELRYEWSLCPVSLSRFTNYECPVTEDILEESLKNAGVPIGSVLPFSLELGTEETASLTNVLTPETAQILCQALGTAELPAGTAPPGIELSCGKTLELTVLLNVTAGQDTETAFKRVNLILEPGFVPNQNPTLDGLSLEDGDGGVIETIAESTPEVSAGTSYEMQAEADIEIAEEFTAEYADGTVETRREVVFITWNVTGGVTDTSRTSFVDGQIDFEGLLINQWKTPLIEEAVSPLSIFLVVQDERGGVNWLTAEVNVQEAPK